MNRRGKTVVFTLVFLVVLGIITTILVAGFDIVPAGNVGVTDTFGVVGDKHLEPGLHWTGLTTSAVNIPIRIQRVDYESGSASKDLQSVASSVTVNFRLTPSVAPDIYKTIGKNYQDIIVFPVVQEAVKGSTARYTAEELITKRAEVKEAITKIITDKLEGSGLIVTEVAITDFEFSAEFNKAIELKQTAEQEALKAVNEKRRAITQSEAIAEKQMIEADANAYAVKVNADANAYAVKVNADAQAYSLKVVREELSKGKELVQYRAIEQWNGELPYLYTSDNGMLFNLPVGTN
jgi:prohibitin 2